MNKLKMLISLIPVVALVVACGSATVTPTTEPATPTILATPTVLVTPTVPVTTTATPPLTCAPSNQETVSTPAPGEMPAGVKNILTLKLRPDLKWSDGTLLTAKDLLGVYNLAWAQGDSIWGSLQDVVALDDTTLQFLITNPGPRALYLLLRIYTPAPYSQYGKWMDQACTLRQAGLAQDSDDVKKMLDDLLAFRPDTEVVYGPFAIDPTSVAQQQLELIKNPTGFNAGKIGFDKITVYYGETSEMVPLVLSNELDYSTHGFTPTDVKSFQALPNIQIIRGPTGTGPGLWFNESFPPFDKKEVRQAFGYIIDRQEVATVAMDQAGKPIQYLVGFPDELVNSWLSSAVIAKLNPYNKDWSKAEELLKAADLKKVGDIWQTEEGKPFSVELQVPADFADWLGAAQNVADQLTNFGIKATVLTFPSSERATRQTEDKYQILVDLALRMPYPHPQPSYNYFLSAPRNNPESQDTNKGLNWPWNQTAPDGTSVRIPDLLNESVMGFDPTAQRPIIETLAQIYNDQLPVLGLFHRYSNDPMDTQTRVTNWRPLTDPIYKNNQGTDNYIAIQMLNGELKPTSTNADKSFHTGWPYPQPPKGNLNYYANDSLVGSVGPVAVALQSPPLFWYMWADDKYVPAVAESYELK